MMTMKMEKIMIISVFSNYETTNLPRLNQNEKKVDHNLMIQFSESESGMLYM
mgnify:CR=1 FL=1